MNNQGCTLVLNDPKDTMEQMYGSDRLLYREADDAFKSRLNTAIQIGWVYNTALTIIVIMGIFYLLGLQMILGLILGILLALFANFRFLIIQVSKSSRWEIYRNRVAIPRGFQGGQRVILFKDIEEIERRNGTLNDKVVIKMADGSRINIDVGGQEGPLNNLILVYDKYSKVRSRQGTEITIPSGS